jgi:hypothetical protein
MDARARAARYAALVAAGHTLAQIGVGEGISKQAVSLALRRYGYSVRAQPGRRSLCPPQGAAPRYLPCATAPVPGRGTP